MTNTGSNGPESAANQEAAYNNEVGAGNAAAWNGVDQSAPASFGALLRHMRKRRGLSQEALADIAQVNVRTIQNCEAGGRPRLGTLERLATALSLDPTDRDQLFLKAQECQPTTPAGTAESRSEEPADMEAAAGPADLVAGSTLLARLALLVRRRWAVLVAVIVAVGATVTGLAVAGSPEQVSITTPAEHAQVPFHTTVRGTAKLPANAELWLVVQPQRGDPAYYVATLAPIRVDATGQWVAGVGVGKEGRHFGESFRLVALVSPQDGCVQREMARRSTDTQYARMAGLPADCTVADQIEVVRR